VSTRDIPNLLGLGRIILTPLLVWCLLRGDVAGIQGAIVLLALMAVSDIVDGPLARRMGVVSPLGVFVDTISDKIFVAAAMLPMVERDLLPAWLVFAIFTREFAVTGLRSHAAAAGVVIAARAWGKQKLTVTVTALIWRLVDVLAAPYADAGGAAGALALLASVWPVVLALALMWTIVSGLEYFWLARGLLLRPRSEA
jgi:CDP-diacylglycerol--glycerol-3-phosphate 3-phosphatidyltransferase